MKIAQVPFPQFSLQTGILFAIAVLLVDSGVGHCASQSGIILKIANVPGESTLSRHVGEIDLTAYSSNLTLPITNGQVSSPMFADLVVTKPIDKSSPVLALKCATATVIPNLTIFVIKPLSAGGTYDKFKITLINVLVSNFSATSSTNGEPAESVSLHYNSVQWSYTPLDASGNPTTPVTSSFP